MTKITPLIYTGNDVSYIDVPGVSFFSQYIFTQDNMPFLAALDRYKRIDKTKVETLKTRILLLNFLKNKLSPENIYEAGIITNIERKINHLTLLQYLFSENVLLNTAQLYNPLIEQDFKSPNLGLLSLRNDHIYDYENNIMLGMYLLEVIDPAHRFNLSSYVDKWKTSASKLPFFLYLESHCNYDLIPQIKYFTNEELQKLKVSVENGLLTDASSNVLSSNPNKEFIFILDAQNQLYGTHGSKSIKHTSMSRGYPVKSAGFLRIENGLIKEIGMSSGHYFPTPESTFPLLQYLKAHNVTLDETTPIQYHKNYRQYSMRLRDLGKC